MTLATAAAAAIAVLIGAAFLLGATIVVGRAIRQARESRRTRLAAPARRMLLALTAGDDEELVEELVTLPAAPWRAVEPTAIALLGKVRGEAHAALVTVFERRGAAERAQRELRRRDPVRRARAAEVLGNLQRADALPALRALLADPDPDVRVVAARALGRIGEPAAAEPLLASLAERRSVPSQLIAHAVARLGPGAQPYLVAALGNPNETVRSTAAEVLGLIGAVGAARQVEAVLREDASLEVRIRAARTLGRLGTRSALTALLHAAEPTQPATLRVEAVRALGELGAVAAATPLAVLLADPLYRVAHHAARSLLRLGPAGRDMLQAAVDRAAADRAASDRAASDRAASDRAAAGDAAAHAEEALAIAALEEQRRRMAADTTPAEPRRVPVLVAPNPLPAADPAPGVAAAATTNG